MNFLTHLPFYEEQKASFESQVTASEGGAPDFYKKGER